MQTKDLSHLDRHTVREEIANAVTHGIGAVLAVAGLAVLVTLAALRGDPWRIVSFSIYGTTLVLLYTMSTLYHSFTNPRVKALFRIFDHAAIYLLIAGTYTPLLLVTLRGPLGWTLFAITWACAVAGVLQSVLFLDRFKLVALAAYIVMGWQIIFAVKPLFAALPPGGIAWLVAGGVFYTGGVAFYAIKRIPANHAIWHGFVLAGSICHFCTMLFYILPRPCA